MGLFKLRSLLKLNFRFLLDYEFLRDGRYTNVASGQQYYDGSDMSILLCDTNADNQFYGLSDGQVWQSPFRNWVYESGVVLNDVVGIRNLDLPTICSGVYVSGIFRATDQTHSEYDSTAAHHIDWLNGRIIFDDPKPLDAKVQAAFAYKHVRMGFEHDFNNEQRYGVLSSKYTTNPLTGGNMVYPSGGAQPFPAVFIETFSRTSEGYELGNRSLKMSDRMYFYIWAQDDITRDDITDTISYQQHKMVPLIDFNLAPLPLSGIYNEKSPEYLPYQELLKNPTLTIPGTIYGTSSVIGYMSYINDVIPTNDTPYAEFERSRVEYIVDTTLFAPNGPLGTITGGYSFKGGTEYF